MAVMNGINWILVYIAISSGGSVSVEKLGQFTKLRQCFAMRHHILVKSGSKSEYFPIGQQAICVKAKLEN
jgi:hypothetical protein